MYSSYIVSVLCTGMISMAHIAYHLRYVYSFAPSHHFYKMHSLSWFLSKNLYIMTWSDLLDELNKYQVIANMRVLMTEDSNSAVSNSFLLDDDSRYVTRFSFSYRYVYISVCMQQTKTNFTQWAIINHRLWDLSSVMVYQCCVEPTFGGGLVTKPGIL